MLTILQFQLVRIDDFHLIQGNTDNSQTKLQFDSCFNQTASNFSTAESSQQLSHSSQLTAVFSEFAAQPNTALHCVPDHQTPIQVCNTNL